MRADLRYLLSTFTARDRFLLVMVVLAQFTSALLDLVGIAVVFPLMQTLTGASLDSGVLGRLYDILGGGSRERFTIALALVMILAFLAKAVLASIILWWSSGIVVRLQTTTSRRLLQHYLTEPYLRHRDRNVGEVISAVGQGAQMAHTSVLGGLLQVLSQAMSIGLIAAFLLVVAPLPTLAAIAYFAIVVFGLQRALAPANRKAGLEAQNAAWASSHALVDSLHGFRELTMHDAQGFFVDRFDAANVSQAQSARRANFLAMLPKSVLELTTMAAIALLVILSVATGSEAAALPTLSLFVAASIRILPSMVALTATLGTIKVGRAGLEVVVRALQEALTSGANDRDPRTEAAHPVTGAPIEVQQVGFRYPGAGRDVLRDVTLHIPTGSSLALAGPSGSGKTTLVNIILGLIPPTSGSVAYGDVPIRQSDQWWHDVVAYVPQDVYVADDTLAGNIAFGVPEDQSDHELVRRSADRALLGDLLAELPDGLDTRVGERGSRLSGGQRQRVGIARALYREPQVLVLDEATSALDNETEHRMTEAIRSLHGEITTIIVAHRLSTVRHARQLAFLADGRVEAVGTFDEVVSASPRFARLVALGQLDLQEGPESA